ncbi:hypothetical protein IMZ48_38635, partial [Candidatus Bathyarchaeota archaeon]|nr:hypothetical protein [Candidatus Bathyarchaeota archaeon]
MPQSNMDAELYLRAISAVAPDVLDSIDAAIQKATIIEKCPRAGIVIPLYGSLKEAVWRVQDILNPEENHMSSARLKALDDGVECCRLLASVLSPEIPDVNGKPGGA